MPSSTLPQSLVSPALDAQGHRHSTKIALSDFKTKLIWKDKHVHIYAIRAKVIPSEGFFWVEIIGNDSEGFQVIRISDSQCYFRKEDLFFTTTITVGVKEKLLDTSRLDMYVATQHTVKDFERIATWQGSANVTKVFARPETNLAKYEPLAVMSLSRLGFDPRTREREFVNYGVRGEVNELQGRELAGTLYLQAIDEDDFELFWVRIDEINRQGKFRSKDRERAKLHDQARKWLIKGVSDQVAIKTADEWRRK